MENQDKQNIEPLVIEMETNKEGHTESKPFNETTPLIDKEIHKLPPLATEERDSDELSIPHIDSVDGDDEKHDETINLGDRAGEFPFAPGFGPNSMIAPTLGETIPDVNMYQNKKTVAQGMMDLALFSANANQLRYVLESTSSHPYYYPGLILITFSLLFQVAVGVGLLWNTRYDVKDEKEICIANKINNFTIIGIFLVTVINVFICAFGTTAGPPAAAVPVAAAGPAT